MKIVVFDLDETLGYFTQFGIFWDCLNKYLNTAHKPTFTEVLDLYPEFLRPNIMNILNYLKKKKHADHCNKVLIYTNNMGPRKWAEQIISYFEDKIKYKLFDQIIAAFKINGKRVELNRTTHNKTHGDLIQCTKISQDTEICFIDDVFYPGMANDNVYYINIKPYFYSIPFHEMLKRFKGSRTLTHFCDEQFTQSMTEYMNMYHFAVFNKNKDEYEVDKILGKHIIYHLQKFFNNSTKNRTVKNTKNRVGKHNNTLKNMDKS
jgi:hypothetical protein